jgi:hypothetical protein
LQGGGEVPSDEPEPMVAAALALAERAAGHGFKGPDPYDGLLGPWPTPLIGGRLRRQALMQIHARSPVDVRRLYRRGRHALIPKALGIFASVGARAVALGALAAPPRFASHAIDVLCADRTAGARAWGYHWDMQTRWSFYAAGSPNAVVTAFAVAGLLDAAASLGRDDVLARAREAATWVLDELWVEAGGYFAYHPARPAPSQIYNASLLGAWTVHAALGGDGGAHERVAGAVERVLAAQRADGSWAYGDGTNLGWADSFHTGYVLTCLDRLRDVDPRIDDAVERGASYYRQFFDGNGRARLWAHKAFPEDGHSAGTGLTTLALLSRRGLIDPELLDRVSSRMLATGIRDGHAVHRRYRYGRSTVHYPRWCDAHVALGLVDAAAAALGAPDLARAAGRPRLAGETFAPRSYGAPAV